MWVWNYQGKMRKLRPYELLYDVVLHTHLKPVLWRDNLIHRCMHMSKLSSILIFSKMLIFRKEEKGVQIQWGSALLKGHIEVH